MTGQEQFGEALEVNSTIFLVRFTPETYSCDVPIGQFITDPANQALRDDVPVIIPAHPRDNLRAPAVHQFRDIKTPGT